MQRSYRWVGAPSTSPATKRSWSALPPARRSIWHGRGRSGCRSPSTTSPGWCWGCSTRRSPSPDPEPPGPTSGGRCGRRRRPRPLQRERRPPPLPLRAPPPGSRRRACGPPCPTASWSSATSVATPVPSPAAAPVRRPLVLRRRRCAWERAPRRCSAQSTLIGSTRLAESKKRENERNRRDRGAIATSPIDSLIHRSSFSGVTTSPPSFILFMYTAAGADSAGCPVGTAEKGSPVVLSCPTAWAALTMARVPLLISRKESRRRDLVPARRRQRGEPFRCFLTAGYWPANPAARSSKAQDEDAMGRSWIELHFDVAVIKNRRKERWDRSHPLGPFLMTNDFILLMRNRDGIGEPGRVALSNPNLPRFASVDHASSSYRIQRGHADPISYKLRNPIPVLIRKTRRFMLRWQAFNGWLCCLETAV